MLAVFNVRLLGYDPYIDLTLARRLNVTMLDSIEELAEQSDILTVHCGWTQGNDGSRHAERVGTIGATRGLLIVNSRMPIVDEDALCELVKAQRLYAALNSHSLAHRPVARSGISNLAERSLYPRVQ